MIRPNDKYLLADALCDNKFVNKFGDTVAMTTAKTGDLGRL